MRSTRALRLSPLVVALFAAACGQVQVVPDDAGGVDGLAPDAVVDTDAPSATPIVTIVRTGTASGTVVGSVGGLDCGTSCAAPVALGTVVVLTATPAAGASFAGWTGPCSGSAPSCSFPVTADVTVGATFTVTRHTVGLTLVGNGTGSVASSPAGLACPGVCSTTVEHGTQLTLTATSQAGSLFLGWSGASCSGTGSCTVVVDGDVQLNAAFALTQSLVVTRSGTGSGNVASAPAGIACGADCSETYPPGTPVTLTATATTDSIFTGWSGGGCSGTGTCTVTVNAAATVDAQFTRRQYVLTVARAGTGTGTVSSSPAGINCGTDCTETYAHGTTVALTATPSGTATFTGWSGGGCVGIGGCAVTLAAATTVTASFTAGATTGPNLVFVTSTTTAGNFGGVTGGDAICGARASAAGLAGTYRAWLSTSSVAAIDRLGSASGWVRTDGKPFANSQADLVAGKIYYPILTDELGVPLPYATAWTGTTDNGQWDGGQQCGNWTNTTSVGVTAGSTLGATGDWTAATGNSCSSELRLYCFGIDRASTVTVVPTPGRKIFPSAGTWLPGGGIVSADALCASEAANASLPGTFKALLATTTASAASRFSTSGATWVRPDGIPITATAAQLFSADFYLTTPVLQANGSTYMSYNPRRYVWSGASTLTSIGTSASTCSNWSSSSPSLVGVLAELGWAVPSHLFGGIEYLDCSQPQRLVCMQQ